MVPYSVGVWRVHENQIMFEQKTDPDIDVGVEMSYSEAVCNNSQTGGCKRLEAFLSTMKECLQMKLMLGNRWIT